MTDRGAATVWVLLAAVVLWSAATWGIALASTASARARASTAADLAALAGAARASAGETVACAHAARVAAANDATVRDCALDESSAAVEVVVETAGRGPFARGAPALARARAGPYDAQLG